MKATKEDRERLTAYLKKFYEYYPQEKHTVFHFVRDFKRRLKDNKDAWIGVSGDTSTGKSLFVLTVQILFGRPFDLTKNVTYIPKGDEIVDKFKKLRFNTLLVDEAAKEMRAVNWQSKAQQGVNTTAMTDRFYNNMVFMNMPNFNEFTKSMRKGSLLFRAILPYRTKAYARVIIQRKSRNWRSDDPWCDKLANERYEKAQKKHGEIDNETILKIERSMPNTIMDFIVPNLELILPHITAEYERLKKESREEVNEEASTDKKQVWKDKYTELLTKVSRILCNNELNMGVVKVTKKDIAGALGIAPQTLNKYLEKPIPEDQKVKPRFLELKKNLESDSSGGK